ncbi:MAG: hypothetical protein IPK63_16510 [Candidatus Competibacteraceae bacterium]|nr:hypothetical protein [Candidatus Competibacteraceae bacterium]
MKYPWLGWTDLLLILSLTATLAGCGDSEGTAHAAVAPAHRKDFLKGDYRSPPTFSNPYAHIYAQCYIGNLARTQNACLFCPTNVVSKTGLGNNFASRGSAAFQLT